ncbi:SAM hydrolase/SAM-dependent halogenase family protein [Atribacter laminatus]|uniref:Adenosyl-chloride synthase n=1 Tax=Atribacter laminatus TaxID=2847778 RepID=A0A7T1F294_ATRLM|nr:SAM-dependent chlorinase/fluorinase [Atribacter laminatus]QPM67030.1 Adenosyl-chloride synthase [Atribacter laminatus]
MRFIAFLTDWGMASYYVGIAKSVMKQINPGVEIIDISHDIQPFNIREAMYILHRTFPDFPPETIFCSVVDYGVGTERFPVAVELTNGSFLVGPDNGTFTLLIEQYSIKKAVILQNPSYFFRLNPSSTFHGRDIFAPVSARLSMGVPLEHFGPTVDSLRTLSVNRPKFHNHTITGEVAFCDRFGNIETNIPGQLLNNFELQPGDPLDIMINECSFNAVFFEAYGLSKKGQILVHTDSSDFVEIAVNQGNAREVLLDNKDINQISIINKKKIFINKKT